MGEPSSQKLILYVWPGRWNLPSIDPTCLTAILFLQLMAPDDFTLLECVNPDLSPNAQLPFLVHEQQVVASLFSIFSYVSSLKRRCSTSAFLADSTLQAKEKAQKAAWIAHAQANFGDLLLYTFFSANWTDLTHPTLCSMLSLPQRYYVPNRLRECHVPRLEAAGLWNLPGAEDDLPTKPFQRRRKEDSAETTIRKAFEREKVLEKARPVLDIYNRLLDKHDFFFPGKLSTLDLIIASHTLILLEAPFTDRTLPDVILEYSSLVKHARTIQTLTAGAPAAQLTQSLHWKALIPWASKICFNSKHNLADSERTDEDTRFDQIRWGWMIASAAALAYGASTLAMRIKIVQRRLEQQSA